MSHLVLVTDEMRAAFIAAEDARHEGAVTKLVQKFNADVLVEEREHALRQDVNVTITRIEVRDEGEA